MEQHVVIIGAGPAGLSCATYLNRLGIGSLILFDTFGGKQNYYRTIYGLYPQSRLSTKRFLQDQIRSLRTNQSSSKGSTIETLVAQVETITRNSQGKYIISCKGGESIKAYIVIVATGTDVYIPEIENLALNSFSTFKDYPFNFLDRSNKVLILGAGHTSSEVYSEICSKVSEVLVLDITDKNFVNLNSERKAIFKRLQKTTIAFDSTYRLEKDKVEYISEGLIHHFHFDQIFLCTGEKANTQFLPQSLLNADSGRIEICLDDDPKHTNMSKYWDGLFTIGDTKHALHTSNIAFAIADGMRTALSVCEYLKNN